MDKNERKKERKKERTKTNPGRGKIFFASGPSFLYNGYPVFPGGNAAASLC
jgi:hypothetical protein